jgi:APA family basic amino acid/polyamine antiporter
LLEALERKLICGPSVAAVTISFLLAGLVCIPNALCYAELASRFPALVGGVYLYAYTAFNELVAFLVFCQLMLDYHIGAASIVRSLSSYIVNILELIPALNGNIPTWFGPGGKTLLGGVFSINILAPILLTLFTVLLCQGVRESSTINAVMTVTKVRKIILYLISVTTFSLWHFPMSFGLAITNAFFLFVTYY